GPCPLREATDAGSGLDKVVGAVAYDRGVADLPHPLSPGGEALDELTRVSGLETGTQDRLRGGELHDVERDLTQRRQGVQVTDLGRAGRQPVEHDHLTVRWKALQEGVP